MKGLDLHRSFFEDCGKPLLREAFPDEFPRIAVASVGFGSDRLGADDEFSRDHCWEPGFQLFSDRLPPETLKRMETHCFERLPWEHRGFRRTDALGSNNAIRAWTVDEFFSAITSFATPPSEDRDWLLIADEALCHATNGEVFHDPTGDFTRRRDAFGAFPENVRRFKLAGRAWRIDIQRYQMERCIAHGEDMAADLMLHEGLREVFHFVCLVNRRYAPQDRWLHWFARRLPILSGEIEPLVSRIRETTDVRVRLSRFIEILDALSGYVYREGLATRGDYEWASLPSANPWWADLLRAVTGDLKDFPVPAWVGIEYRYASQICYGGISEELSRKTRNQYKFISY